VGYQLDPVGNRTSDTSSLAGINSGSFGYNADDEVNTETYDANGNTLFTGGKNFTYDAENHLTSMTTAAQPSPHLRRLRQSRAKTVNGVTTSTWSKTTSTDRLPAGLGRVDQRCGDPHLHYGLQRISEDQIVNGAWTPSFYGYDGGGNIRS